MRVVFTPHAYAPALGGAEHHARRLAEGLARGGDEVHVVVPNVSDAEAFFEWGHDRGGLAKEVLDGVMVHRIPYLPGWWNIAARLGDDASRLRRARRRYSRHLEATLETLQADVVVTLPHALPNVQETTRLRQGARWKMVYAPLLHEEDPYWAVPPVAAVVAAADGVIALTEHERDRLISAYGADPVATIVLPPGVDLPAAQPAAQRDPVVLFLGRRSASKRLDVLHAAMQLVWRSVPEARLVVAGPPPVRGEDPAAAMAGDPRIEILDRVDDLERDRLIGSARVVASASVVEAFGITTLEAWAHATPVVVADTPVRRSVVRQGTDGIVAAPDAAGIADGILVVLTDPERGRRLGSAGRERVAAEFRWDQIVERTREFLRRV